MSMIEQLARIGDDAVGRVAAVGSLAELDALGSPALARGLPRSLASGREVTTQDRRARRITGDLVWFVEVAGTLARVAAVRADDLESHGQLATLHRDEAARHADRGQTRQADRHR